MIKKVFILIITFCSVACRHLPEGSACRVNGYPGVCRPWRQCYTLVIDHKNKVYPTTCSFNGSDPIICCTSCYLVEDVSKAAIDPRGHMLWKNDQESWNKCIDYFISLPYIIKEHCYGSVDKYWNRKQRCFDVHSKGQCGTGGWDARRSEYPHMVLLGYGSTLETAQYLCGGTIISDRYILTAAHCISSPSLGPVKYAALGILKRSDPHEMWQKYLIETITPHPEYHSPAKYHDLALLRTSTIISFNENVLPACLPNLSDPVTENEAMVTGWGATGPDTDLADTLQVVPLTKYDESNCSNQYKKHRNLCRGYDHNIQMCYGDHDNVRDTCKGDSGGPLQVGGFPFAGSPPTVIGVTSYGRACGRVDQPGMYTRLAPYVKWIDSIVWG